MEERKTALMTLLQQKMQKEQMLTKQRNDNMTEIVKIQGQLELLKELEAELAAVAKKTEPVA